MVFCVKPDFLFGVQQMATKSSNPLAADVPNLASVGSSHGSRLRDAPLGLGEPLTFDVDGASPGNRSPADSVASANQSANSARSSQSSGTPWRTNNPYGQRSVRSGSSAGSAAMCPKGTGAEVSPLQFQFSTGFLDSASHPQQLKLEDEARTSVRSRSSSSSSTFDKASGRVLEVPDVEVRRTSTWEYPAASIHNHATHCAESDSDRPSLLASTLPPQALTDVAMLSAAATSSQHSSSHSSPKHQQQGLQQFNGFVGIPLSMPQVSPMAITNSDVPASMYAPHAQYVAASLNPPAAQAVDGGQRRSIVVPTGSPTSQMGPPFLFAEELYAPGSTFAVMDPDNPTEPIQYVPSQCVACTQGSARYLSQRTSTLHPCYLCKRYVLFGACEYGAECSGVHIRRLPAHSVVPPPSGPVLTPAVSPSNLQSGKAQVGAHVNPNADGQRGGLELGAGVEMLPEGVVLMVYPPNNAQAHPQPIPSEKILRTAGASNVYHVLRNAHQQREAKLQEALRVTGRPGNVAPVKQPHGLKPRHCAHFQFKRLCNLGNECNFIHSLVPFAQSTSGPQGGPRQGSLLQPPPPPPPAEAQSYVVSSHALQQPPSVPSPPFPLNSSRTVPPPLYAPPTIDAGRYPTPQQQQQHVTLPHPQGPQPYVMSFYAPPSI